MPNRSQPQVMSSAPLAGESEDRKDVRRMAEGRAGVKRRPSKSADSQNPLLEESAGAVKPAPAVRYR